MTESIKCECGCGREANERIDGYAHSRYRGTGLKGAWFARLCSIGSNEHIAKMNDRIRARHSQVTEPKFYGTQPATLPETLPVGTKSFGTDGCIYTAANVVALTESMVYFGTWDWIGRGHRGGMNGGIHPAHIDWSSVPIQEAKPAALPSMPLPWRDIDWASTLAQVQRAIAQTQEQANADVAAVLAYEATLKPATCRDCSAPATHGEHCVYCANRHGSDAAPRRLTAAQLLARQEAMERRLRVDARERPRATADSRMLALQHPWSSDEGEP